MENPILPNLAVVYRPINSLVPNPRNARTHSKRQIRQIADSVGTFGFISPVLIDANNNIIAHHGCVEAAKLLGMDKVPTIRIEHLTQDQLRAYIIADNRLAELAGWDQTILSIELQHLLIKDTSFDVTITGFDVPEIDLMIQDATSEKEEDNAIEIDKTLPGITAPGDLWRLGRHRILCGNALHGDTYETLMRGALADLIFTDPPYNVRIDGHVSGKGSIHHREFAMASGEMSEAEFSDFLRRVCRLLTFNSHPGSIHFICMDWRHARELLVVGKDIYHELKNICIWTKNNGGMGSLYRSQHEMVFVFKHGSAPHRNNIQLGQYGRHRTNIWNYPGANTFSRQSEEGNLAALHPTVKPVSLVADAILDCSVRGGVVLDVFLGSGTTLIAAERVGRVCYGLELDPLYVDLAIGRWQRHTGDSAIHVATGKRFDDLAMIQAEARHG